jgi:hypothetical protein
VGLAPHIVNFELLVALQGATCIARPVLAFAQLLGVLGGVGTEKRKKHSER